jgi:hypothetical protein
MLQVIILYVKYSLQASLRMVGEELRQELQQLRQESDNQQQAALKMEKQHVGLV